ncbi:MAG: hypothetical protein PHR14_10960, partial [Oscillospiraceae bacterium]|nr:hypothetical protein [Oscillospiraceae bacterium]
KAFTEGGEELRSETLDDLVSNFGFWMGPELKEYAGREAELPFDEHELKALVAPRVLFLSEAASDIWSNPVGNWQTTLAAREVYKFLGAEDKLLWYFRSGTHHHKIEDVEMLVCVIKHFKHGEPLNDQFFKLPFTPTERIFDWKCPDNTCDK